MALAPSQAFEKRVKSVIQKIDQALTDLYCGQPEITVMVNFPKEGNFTVLKQEIEKAYKNSAWEKVDVESAERNQIKITLRGTIDYFYNKNK